MIVVGENLSTKSLEAVWRAIKWPREEEELQSLQRDIAIAAHRRDSRAVEFYQKKLVMSIAARAIAVKAVSESVAQPGVDGIRWCTGADKMRAALSLTAKSYISKPTRMINLVPKGHSKERTVKIPTAYDRAMHVLYSYALDPVAEATGDRMSFAFRKGRSYLDLHAFIMKLLSARPTPAYVIKTDVKSFYGTISHEWLLKNIPMDANVLREFLKAGHFFCGELFAPDDYGISLGSSLSPILGNMTLDGVQNAIYDGLHGSRYGNNVNMDFMDGGVVRYADDMLISAGSMTSVKKIKDIIKDFLAVRGLRLSDEKTKIIPFAAGGEFEFMSREYRYDGKVVTATPSKAAVASLTDWLQELIYPYHERQHKLIGMLNKKLIGWGTYHKITDAEQAFRHIDCLVTALLLDLSLRLNPGSSKKTIQRRFFFPDGDGNYVYIMEGKPDVRVTRLSDILLTVHKPVITRRNPYLDEAYFESRSEEKAVTSVVGRYRPVWKRQGGKCYYCGRKILADEQKTIIAIDPEFSPTHQNNMAYVHSVCCAGIAEFYKCERPIDTEFDLYSFLLRLNNPDPSVPRRDKFFLLTTYFKKRAEPVFTLQFEEIEKITGRALCPTARVQKGYWKSSANRIVYCWASNGYGVRKVNLKKGCITFERVEDMGVPFEIPKWLLKGRLPRNARVELTAIFEHVQKKYGLPASW